MDTYKVDLRHESGPEAVHVTESTRERALYKAYDEMTDRGYTVVHIGDVSMFDSATETWHVIPEHKKLSEDFA